MKMIPLTQGLFAQEDDNDYNALSQYRWYAHKRGKTFYARRSVGDTKIEMHRQIIGALPGQIVDHIDHDGLHNQRRNFRPCTKQENTQNRSSLSSNNTTGYRGVTHNHKGSREYAAQIKAGYKHIHLGYYYSPVAASKAYEIAANKYFGEFVGKI